MYGSKRSSSAPEGRVGVCCPGDALYRRTAAIRRCCKMSRLLLLLQGAAPATA